MMVSFIIIGRNEGWKLTQCIKSIDETIKYNKLKSSELIYVDSNSKDNSIERAKKFKEVRIFKLIEMYNPAIARNIGALNSTGDILIFLDADMTIHPNFLKSIIVKNQLVHPLIGGVVIDVGIDSDRNIINETPYHYKSKPFYKLITGGAFVINRKEWLLVDGMDNRFIRGEDPELGIRIADQKIFLKSYPNTFVYHYDDKIKSNIPLSLKNLNKSILFSNMLIYRKNIFSIFAWKRFYSHEKSLIALIISLFCVFIFNSILFILFYLVLLVLRSVRNSSKSRIYEQFIYYLIRDVIVLVGFFTFFPNKINTSKIKFEKISGNH